MKKAILFIFITVVIISIAWFLKSSKQVPNVASNQISPQPQAQNPLNIQFMRQKSYPGSDIKIEETLTAGSNYKSYIVSYQSDGLKIYALLDVPDGQRPSEGWPVVIFNHGYIPPDQYKTTERYVAYVDSFARSGYIVIKSDYRGNGSSQGQPEGAYYSSAYATDVLNEISSIKKYPDANPAKIGMWGHSMGGNITLRNLEVSSDIKAAVVWGGVVGSYDDLINNWQRRVTYQPPPRELAQRNNYRQNLISTYGTPASNPTFWNSIDPFYNVTYITAPVELHVGEADEEVPPDFSQKLYSQLIKNGKTAEIYTYPGANHNISSPAFELAMQRSVSFFDKYLKGN